MCGYFCIGFINFMLKGKIFLDYTNLFSPSDYEKNDKRIKTFFLLIDFKKVRMTKIHFTKCKKYKEFKMPKIAYICNKTLLLSSICYKCGSEDEKIFNKEESIEILKIIGLITLKI